MSAIGNWKTITFFWSKLSKLHKKDLILHVTTTFSKTRGKQEQAVDPYVTPYGLDNNKK